MFIVFGILSILAGAYIFQQGDTLSRLSSLSDYSANLPGIFLIVGLSLIVAGSMSIASHDGERRKFIIGSAISYGISFVASTVEFSTGDMAIWSVLSIITMIIYIIWLVRHRDKTETYYDNSMDDSYRNPQ